MVNVNLITGGAGYLGRNLASALAKRGEDVIVLDDLSDPNSSFGVPELNHSRITNIEGSTLDSCVVSKLMRDVDTVIHFACVVGR